MPTETLEPLLITRREIKVMSKKEIIGLVYGGPSEEGPVSIISATSILKNVDYDKFSVLPIFINKDNVAFSQDIVQEAKTFNNNEICNETNKISLFDLNDAVDVIFPVTHGPVGEDGHYQALFELSKVPYVGCNVLTSAVAMDKGILKDLCVTYGIPQTPYLSISKFDYDNNEDSFNSVLESDFGYPMFIKPANLGSSVGISKANNPTELTAAIELAFKYDSKIIVEQFVEVREIEIGILGNCPYQLSEIGEAVTSAEFYDFDAKYISTEGNQIIIPAILPNSIKEQIQEISISIAKAINIRGLSRIDFFYDEKNNRILLNEINTLPGFTAHSMYPMLFGAAGTSYKDLITKLVELAKEAR